MKKLLLTLSAFTAITMADSFEEAKKGCDENNDIKACINLAYMYNEGKGIQQDNPKAYQYWEKVNSIAKQMCDKGNKKVCSLQSELEESLLNTLPGAFSVDGVYSGMYHDSLLQNKFKKRDDGLYDVMLTEISPLLSKMMYGGKVVGQALNYNTTILNKKANVKVFLTSKTKNVYAVIVEWNDASAGGGIDTMSAVQKSLTSKYGAGKSIDKENLSKMFLDGEEWKPNNRTTISYYTSMNEQMGMKPIVVYLDSYYFQQNTEESKATAKTNKL